MSHHFIKIQDLSTENILFLLNRAQQLLDTIVKPQAILNHLAGKILLNLFFEPSTRTRQSFSIAAQRLGMLVLNPAIEQSSVIKGESLKDTLYTYAAMGCQFLVVRHKQDYFADEVAQITQSLPLSVINAGDGVHQHPTQTLIDLLTIQQHKVTFSALRVAIIGDIMHSRVAGSLIPGLKLMGVPDIRLIAPAHLLPINVNSMPVNVYTYMESGLKDVDVIVTLRIQRERMLDEEVPDAAYFHCQYGLTPRLLSIAKPEAIVMHPGPINRDVEISAEVADGPQSVILQQVQNGIAIRMAVLEWLAQANSDFVPS